LGKIILIIAVFAAVYFILRAYARAIGKRGDAPKEGVPTEDMVRCGHCGVHLPRSDSTVSGDRYYCSGEHKRLHEG